jgi:hypothetical protein
MDSTCRRTQFESREEAEANLLDGEIVGDRGPYVWPRYTVLTPPQVGDKVSSGFNGDYYPEGTVVKVSKGPSFRRVETSTGRIFWRTRNGKGAGWLAHKTWGLVPGHIDRRNPSF